MKIDEFIFKKYKWGWMVDSPYDGVDKEGNYKIQYRRTYHLNLKQVLAKVRDVQAKDCESVEELISLLTAAHDIDKRVLAANGLV